MPSVPSERLRCEDSAAAGAEGAKGVKCGEVVYPSPLGDRKRILEGGCNPSLNFFLLLALNMVSFWCILSRIFTVSYKLIISNANIMYRPNPSAPCPRVGHWREEMDADGMVWYHIIPWYGYTLIR